MISAVLDANVLFSASLRDFLLWLADSEAFFPYWTEKIQNEWVHRLLEKQSHLKPEKLERTCRIMDSRFPKSLVRGYESIIQTLQLPDAKDRHVLAAAIHKKAKYIVTFNLKDFPKTILQSYDVEAIPPDAFIQQLIPTSSHFIIEAARDNRANLSNPPKTVEQFLATLEQQKLFKTAAFLREHKDKI